VQAKPGYRFHARTHAHMTEEFPETPAPSRTLAETLDIARYFGLQGAPSACTPACTPPGLGGAPAPAAPPVFRPSNPGDGCAYDGGPCNGVCRVCPCYRPAVPAELVLA
jgi:hypothetical protein